MADDDQKIVPRRPPMSVYTAMLLLAFIAISIGCLILSLELFYRDLPLKPLAP
ncbi:MAG: hypothetical protein NTY87_09430 [Planctomycetia bacterium]|nr:hypothetical protein [Planctomycetia bacterium]